MLSFVRDFAMFASIFFSRLGSTPSLNSRKASSTDRCEYHTSRSRIAENARIASR